MGSACSHPHHELRTTMASPDRQNDVCLLFFFIKLVLRSHTFRGGGRFRPIYYIFALLLSLPPTSSRNSDPGSHSRLFSPPTQSGSCLAFLAREGFSFSLADWRRFVPTHATCRLAPICTYPFPHTVWQLKTPYLYLYEDSIPMA